MGGGIVEWFQTLYYGAESCWKVMRSGLGFTIQWLENSLCQLSSKWVPFLNQEKIKQQKDRDGFGLSFAVPKRQILLPIRLLDTFTFYLYERQNFT